MVVRKVLKGVGKAIKPIGYGYGANALLQATALAKEAGDSSGRPPESGPNSQGLPGLLKLVRNL